MPRKTVRHHHVKPVEEVKEEKPQVILKTEVVEEKPTEEIVTSPVGQLAAVVEPKLVESVPEVSTPAVETVQPTVPEVPVETTEKNELVKKSGIGFLWPLWILLAFVLGAGAGFGLSKLNFEKKPVVKTVASKAATTPTVEPTKVPAMVFDRNKIKVKVLNGSGVRGKAGMAQDYLEGLGYKDVQTGNADLDNYEVTEMSVKDSFGSVLEEIKKDVSNKYELNEKVTTLASDDAFDVLVIIGKK